MYDIYLYVYIQGLDRDDGKENGNYYLRFRVAGYSVESAQASYASSFRGL